MKKDIGVINVSQGELNMKTVSIGKAAAYDKVGGRHTEMLYAAPPCVIYVG